MLLVFFPVWLAAWASRSEVFLTNYRPHTGVITSNLAHLIICLPPVRPPLTAAPKPRKTCNDETLTVHMHLWTTQVTCRTCKCGKGVQIAGTLLLSHEFSPSTGSSASSPTSELMSYYYSISHWPFGGGNQICQLLILLPYFSRSTRLMSCKSGLQMQEAGKLDFIIRKAGLLKSKTYSTVSSVFELHYNLLLKLVTSTSMSALVLSRVVSPVPGPEKQQLQVCLPLLFWDRSRQAFHARSVSGGSVPPGPLPR